MRSTNSFAAFFFSQGAPIKPAHHMQSALIQTTETNVFVLIAHKKEARFVAQMERPTNIRVSSRSMLARKTSAFRSFRKVHVEVCQKRSLCGYYQKFIILEAYIYDS